VEVVESGSDENENRTDEYEEGDEDSNYGMDNGGGREDEEDYETYDKQGDSRDGFWEKLPDQARENANDNAIFA
jgi:hypothetical protein